MRGQLEAKDPLLATTDPVATDAGGLKRCPGALVQQEIAAHEVRVLLGQPAGADVTAGLLIGDEHELQRAAGWAPAVPRRPR